MTERINRLSLFANFEMQLGTVRAAAAHVRNHLASTYLIAFLNEQITVVSVGT